LGQTAFANYTYYVTNTERVFSLRLCLYPASLAAGAKVNKHRSFSMGIGTIILIILILLLIGAFPSWPHSRNWGYFPSGTLGVVVVILLILVLLGRI